MTSASACLKPSPFASAYRTACKEQSYVRNNPKWEEEVDGAMPYTFIPPDAPRSDLQLPLRCFNCEFKVTNDKYRSLAEQRWRLSRHEMGRSGHGYGPCTYRCFCGRWFANSSDLREHCRDEGHALPKRYCTKVEVDAMMFLPDGLGRTSNYAAALDPSKPRPLDAIFTEKIDSREEREPGRQRHFTPPMRDGLKAYRTPGVSPRSPSSSGSRRDRRSAHHFNALQGLNSDNICNTGCVKVYHRYHRSRSSPTIRSPTRHPSEHLPAAASQKSSSTPVPQKTIFGQQQP